MRASFRLPVVAVLSSWALSSWAVSGCGGKKPPIQQKPVVDPDTLFLEPVPAATGVLSIDSDQRTWVGPTRITAPEARAPWRIELEDFGQAEFFEVCVQSIEPTEFCQAPEVMEDAGSVAVDDDRLTMKLRRKGYDDVVRTLELTANLDPEAVAAPSDWLPAGTTLYFGRAFDDKPITKVVPMALNVRLGAASDGGRVLSWTADIDVRDQTELTGETTRSGRRLLSRAVVDGATSHSDAFSQGESVADDAGSLFLSRKLVADAVRYGGAPFHDLETSKSGVLVVTGETEVTVQVDDGLWKIPALVATVNGGEGVYVIAADPEQPLILSAIRPGYRIRLMAIGTPGS